PAAGASLDGARALRGVRDSTGEAPQEGHPQAAHGIRQSPGGGALSGARWVEPPYRRRLDIRWRRAPDVPARGDGSESVPRPRSGEAPAGESGPGNRLRRARGARILTRPAPSAV